MAPALLKETPEGLLMIVTTIHFAAAATRTDATATQGGGTFATQGAGTFATQGAGTFATQGGGAF